MSSTEATFDERLRRPMRKHRRMSENGVVRRMGPDGLVSVYPRRRMPRFPLRAVVLLVIVAFAFKAAMMQVMGPGVYDARVAALAEGAPSERAAAWVMQADPVTLAISRTLDLFGI